MPAIYVAICLVSYLYYHVNLTPYTFLIPPSSSAKPVCHPFIHPTGNALPHNSGAASFQRDSLRQIQPTCNTTGPPAATPTCHHTTRPSYPTAGYRQ